MQFFYNASLNSRTSDDRQKLNFEKFTPKNEIQICNFNINCNYNKQCIFCCWAIRKNKHSGKYTSTDIKLAYIIDYDLHYIQSRKRSISWIAFATIGWWIFYAKIRPLLCTLCFNAACWIFISIVSSAEGTFQMHFLVTFQNKAISKKATTARMAMIFSWTR